MFNRLLLTPRVKNITIKQVSYTVTGYECSLEEINSSIAWFNENGVAYFSLMKIQNGLSGFLYPSLKSVRAALEKDLLHEKQALTSVSCTLPKEITTFDVKLNFTLHLTVEYLKD